MTTPPPDRSPDQAADQAPPRLTPRSGSVRRARRLSDASQRRRAGEFLCEGPQAVREALELDDVVLEVWATRAAEVAHPRLRIRADEIGVRWTEVDDDVVRALTDTVHPQGLVARCRSVAVGLPDLLDVLDHPSHGRVPLVAVCADVRDPGNAGTVVRCADAAGADAVVLTGTSVDPHNPKAVRASAGSLFHLPVAVVPDTATVVEALRDRGVVVLAADGTADLDLDDPRADALLAGGVAWLFGNEAWGLPGEVRALADHVVAVPVYGRAESLNLATAAAVCLYAAARARRPGARGTPGDGGHG